MRNLLIWLSLLFSTACFAEEITVDSVVFDHSFDTAAYKNHGVVGHFSLPKFTVENPARSFVLDSINKHLSIKFPFNDREKFLSLFHDASFSYVIRDGYLLIRMFYVKHYYEEKDMFSCPFVFDLKTGKNVTCYMLQEFGKMFVEEGPATCQSEEFSVVPITFDYPYFGVCHDYGQENYSDYSIPKIKTSNPDFLPIVDSINAEIWSKFFYKENCDWGNFNDGCKGVQYSCEIKDGYLKMDLEYIGYGAHGDITNTEVFVVDLKRREGNAGSLEMFTDFQTDTICESGHFGVASVKFQYPIYMEDRWSSGNEYVSYNIPKIMADDSAYSAIADSINNTLYSEISYSGNLDEFTKECKGLNFSCLMESGYLLVDLDYLGGKFGDSWRNLFLFNLKTGRRVSYGDTGERAFPPFSALFTTNGYFEFLNSRGWSEGVKEDFLVSYKDFLTCHDSTELALKTVINHTKMVQFDIEYKIEDEFSFKTVSCPFFSNYFTSCWACEHSDDYWYETNSFDECRKEEVLPYLNQVGRALFDTEKSPIERILKADSYCGKVGHNLFLQLEYQEDDDNSGVVYRDSSLQVAVDISKPKRVKGYLYVNGKRERIKGSFEDDELHLKSRESNWRCSLSYDGKSDVWSGVDDYEVVGCSEGTEETFYYDETD